MQKDEEYKLPVIKYTKYDLQDVPIETKIRAVYMLFDQGRGERFLSDISSFTDSYFNVTGVPTTLSRKKHKRMAIFLELFVLIFEVWDMMDELLHKIFGGRARTIPFQNINQLNIDDINGFVNAAMIAINYLHQQIQSGRTRLQRKMAQESLTQIQNKLDRWILRGMRMNWFKKRYPTFSQDFTNLLIVPEEEEHKKTRKIRRATASFKPGGKGARKTAIRFHRGQMKDLCADLSDNSTVPQLKQLAKQLNMARYSHLNKAQLCRRIAEELMLRTMYIY